MWPDKAINPGGIPPRDHAAEPDPERCPTCDSINPGMHPGIGVLGIADPCPDPFHDQPNPERFPQEVVDGLMDDLARAHRRIEELDERRLYWQGRYQDTIVALDDPEASNTKLREALERIASYFDPADCECVPEHDEVCVNHIARAALSE